MFFKVRTGGRWFLGMVISGAIAFSTKEAQAQITPDKTLPNNSTVRLDGNTRIIEGGTQAGHNLFHSFQEFSVPTGSTAFFNNAADIQNIFSRVTGGSLSNIDGIIKANGTANLFLINPNGIVFGKNASLNVGGSFVGTTANAIQFGDRGFFSATSPEAPSPLLTINPSALLFNQIVAGASIQNSSTAPAGVTPNGVNSSGLRVPDGKNLLLVGGDITMDGGGLRAYGGLVELGGLAGTGTVGLGFDGNNISLSFPSVSTRASVSLINGANVNVSAAGGGSITVNASNLNIIGGSSLIAGIAPFLGFVGAKAGDITLNATGDVKIDGNGTVIANNLQRQEIGNGGNITLSTNSLSLTNGAELVTRTLGQGDAGNVIINATNSVSLDGSGSDIFSSVGSISDTPEQRNAIKGNGGNIQITTSQLSLTNASQLQASTFGQGNAGSVIINATKSVSLDGSGSDIFSSVGSISDTPEQRNAIKGNGGNIQITTSQLSLTNGAVLEADTFGQGNSGNVRVNALDAVSLADADILSAVEAGGVGKGGNIDINAATLSLKDGAQLSANTNTGGRGDAGSINITASDTVSFDGVGRNGFPSSASSAVETGASANGGNLTVATRRFNILNGAEGTVSNLGSGNAGNLEVRADSINLDNFGKLTANSVTGVGGNVSLQVNDILLMRHNSLISNTSGTASAGGNGGNFALNTKFLVAAPNENSNIITNAFNGTGGEINITAFNIFGFAIPSREDLERLLLNDLDFLKLPTNYIIASSQTRPNIVTSGIDPSPGLVQLPINLVDASSQIDTSCKPGSKQQTSSFTITGRGGLPPNPGEPLSTDAVQVDLVTLPNQFAQHESRRATQSQSQTREHPHKSSANPPTQIVEAQGWIVNKNGDVELVAFAPTATPHNPSFNPTSCQLERK